MQTKQDEKLDEVRAILQRLQRISTGTEADDAADPAAASPAPADIASEPAPQQPPPPLPVNPTRIAIFAGAALLLLAGAGLALWPGSEPPVVKVRPPSAAATTTTAAVTQPQPLAAPPEARSAASEQDAERLAHAQSLMDRGKVVEARQVLLADFAERSADAALLLARSYDPNALQLIAEANAPADPDQAERWYRRWSAIAGRDGLVLDQDRLDRIIRSMR